MTGAPSLDSRLARDPSPGDERAVGVVGGRRIALVSAYYPAHGGGMELACAELADALRRAGMRVEWLAQAEGVVPERPGIDHIPLAGTDFIYALSGVPAPLPMPWTLPTIARAVRRADVVIIAEANFALSVVAFVVAKWHRKPIFLVQHVGEPSTVSKMARAVMRAGEALAVRPMVRTAEAVVYVSPVVARHFDGVRTRPESETIGHGLDLGLFRPSAGADERDADRAALTPGQNGKIAAVVGRLTESKGIMVVAEMARRRPDWTFAIAGTGPVDPARWELGNVRILGQLDRAEVARLYRASDTLVLPSPSESFSLVVREALASGCGVLCSEQILETDAGLAPFIVTEEVDLRDVAGTAQHFAAALDRTPTASADEARAYVARQCSPDFLFSRYLRLIERLAGNCGHRA